MSPSEVALPSGATLRIQVAEFAVAKAFFQAVLEEFKAIEIKSVTEMMNVFKDIACIGFSSKRIDATLQECLKRCTIDQGKGFLKIDNDTFEPLERRDDFLLVYMAVAKANLAPFGKSLFAEYENFLKMTEVVRQ